MEYIILDKFGNIINNLIFGNEYLVPHIKMKLYNDHPWITERRSDEWVPVHSYEHGGNYLIVTYNLSFLSESILPYLWNGSLPDNRNYKKDDFDDWNRYWVTYTLIETNEIPEIRYIKTKCVFLK